MAAAFEIILLLLFFGLTACAPQADVEPLRAPTSAGSLQPYQSPVPSEISLPPTPAPTEIPLPSPTPHLYKIAKGDTMGGIALNFGISTEALIAANPDISPSAMSVGQELRIPDGDVPLVLATVEPLPLEIASPDCYPTLSGGIWCFISVYNGTGEIAESVSAEISLYDSEGKRLAKKTAFPLVDQLPADERFALLAFFPDTSANVTAYAILLTALPVPAEDARYLPASLRNVLTKLAWDGCSAEISGEVDVEDASRFWVVAIAYDAAGKIVGARRWESVSGEKVFDLTVASLGHAIESVELIVEAKP